MSAIASASATMPSAEMSVAWSSTMVIFERVPHVVLRETEDWGIRVLDLASPPRRLRGASIRHCGAGPHQHRPLSDAALSPAGGFCSIALYPMAIRGAP